MKHSCREKGNLTEAETRLKEKKQEYNQTESRYTVCSHFASPRCFCIYFLCLYIFDVIFATLLLFFVINSHYCFLFFCIFSRTRQVAFGIHICLSVVVLLLFLCLESQFVTNLTLYVFTTLHAQMSHISATLKGWLMMYVINGFLYFLKYMQNICLANFHFCAFKENCIPGISKAFVADLRTFGWRTRQMLMVFQIKGLIVSHHTSIIK